MNELSLQLDEAFAAEMTERFPSASYAASRPASRLPLSPAEWLAGSGPPGDTAAFARALAAQLGERWAGRERGPTHRQLALTLLAAHAAGRDVSEELVDANRWALLPTARAADLAALMRPETFDAAIPVIAAAVSGHAWSNTVALQIVARAKSARRILPNVHLAWLREMDRTLWLLVSGFGRAPARLAETLGIVVHHAAEATVGRPLPEPTDMSGSAEALVAAASA